MLYLILNASYGYEIQHNKTVARLHYIFYNWVFNLSEGKYLGIGQYDWLQNFLELDSVSFFAFCTLIFYLLNLDNLSL